MSKATIRAQGASAAKFLHLHLNLTPRQAQVLHWIAEGKTNAEIAVILECSFFTVKNHLKEIFQRLGVHSRTAAAACAYRAHIENANTAATQDSATSPRRKKTSPSGSKSS